jgi:ABC-type transport system substrate-binding protein
VALRLTSVGVVLVLVTGVARAEIRPPYGGKVVASLPSAPVVTDPLSAQAPAEVELADLVFDPLYRLDDSGRALPALALALPSSTSPLEMKVPLRTGVHFHDGRPVRPADVVASLKRAQTAAGGAFALATISAITGADDAVLLTLRRPATPADVAALLATPALAITPPGRAPGSRPIGTGPFKVKKIEGHRVELEAFADAWSGRPYLDTLVLRWFDDSDEEARSYEAGESDVSLRGAVAFAGHEPKYPTVMHEGPAVLLHYIGFGSARPFDRDAAFRQGVSMALARSAFRHIGTGETVIPSASPVAPELGGPQPTPATVAASEAGARAGLAPARGGAPLDILVDRTRPDDLDLAARVVAALDRFGVPSSFTALAPVELGRRIAAGQCDLYLGQLVPPAPMAIAALGAAFAAGHDDWLAGKLAEGPVTVDAATAAFAARLPIVPLLHRAVRAHHKRTLRGLTVSRLGRLTFADAYVWTATDEASP